MTSSFDRVRVLWPDHLGLARGKYVPASLADRRGSPLHGDLGARLRPRNDARHARAATGTKACPTSTPCTTSTTFARVGSRTPGSSWPTSSATASPSPSHRAPRCEGRSPTGGRWATSPSSASSSRRTSSPPTERAAGSPLDTPGRLRLRHGPGGRPPRAHRRDLGGLRRGGASPSSRSTPSTTRPSSSSRCATATRCAPPTTASSSRCWRARWRTASGCLLTFMGKPLSRPRGIGAARQLLVRKTARATTRSTTPRPTTASRLLAKHSIGGLLAHHRALAGLCAPTVNAYKRLRPASLSGYWANWGYDHRGATIRVPASAAWRRGSSIA